MPSSPRSVLRLASVTKRFGALVANDRVSIELGEGEILALLGENGAGKTTLMNILFGHYVPDEGTVEVAGADGVLRPLRHGSPHEALQMGIGMVHQHFTLAENLTVLDNVMLGTELILLPFRRKGQARRRLLDLQRQAGLKVELDAPVSSLSVGEKQRVEILKALFRNARILILDEPTAVLTPQETDTLFEILRLLVKQGLSVIFISHKLNEVLSVSDRVAVMRSGRVVASAGVDQVNREQLAEMMVGRPVPPTARESLPRGAPALELSQVTVADGSGKPALVDATLTVHRSEIVGIAGVSGNGQATLAHVLSGLAPISGGDLRVLGERVAGTGGAALLRRGVARIPEDRHRDGIVGDMTVWENLIMEDLSDHRFSRRSGLLRRAAARAHARRLIEQFDIRCPGPEAVTRLLSGGNIQKLVLGRVLDHEPGLILANQPTRGLDVGAVNYVHRRLLEARRKGAAVLLISEDLDELFLLSDRIAVLYRGRLSEAFRTDAITVREIGILMAGHAPSAAA